MEIVFNNAAITIPWWGLISFSFSIALIVTYISIPTILTVSHKIGLYESSNGRTSHHGQIPTLGGVAIFAGIVLAGSLLPLTESDLKMQYILAALVILFFTGMKDDLLILDPNKKLLAQLLAVAIVVILGDFRITNFHGLANIYEVSYLASVLFTIFVFIVIINGFNLIDGIDGLSSGIGILVSITFGTYFIFKGEHQFASIAFILAGSLIAFFRFNVFSKKNRIFLGDTGALSIGLIIAVITVRFLDFQQVSFQDGLVAAPAIAFGILIVPLFDTLRVFVLRIFGGESPFSADRKHIHHRLLDLGFSHIKATLMILSVNMFFIGLVFLFNFLGNLKLIFIIMVLATIVSYIPMHILDRRRSKIPIKHLKVSRNDVESEEYNNKGVG